MKTREAVGLKAKRNGDFFENLIMFFAVRSGFEFIKIPSGCINLGKKLIPTKSPFDFILVSDELTVFCDAKSTQHKNFEHSSIDQDQVRNLSKLDNGKNICGYLINFNGEVGFAPVRLLKSIERGQSVKLCDCLPMGTMKVMQFDILKLQGVAS